MPDHKAKKKSSFNYTLSIHWQYQRQNGGTHEIGTIAKLQ